MPPASRARWRPWAVAQKVELGDVAIESSVSLITTEERGFNVAVTLDVTLPEVSDADQAKAIVAAAHQVCPYSNATRGNVEVELVANGQPVAGRLGQQSPMRCARCTASARLRA